MLYVLKMNDGSERHLHVPPSRMITFGPAVPFAGRNSGAVGTAVRVYGKVRGQAKAKRLLAVIPNVRELVESSVRVENIMSSVPTSAPVANYRWNVMDVTPMSSPPF